jgi:transcriptional regulator with PAS, ATPase and Fis domain
MGWHFAVVFLMAALAATGAYSFHQRKILKQSTDQTAQVAASLNQTNAQVQQLTAKLDELTAPKPAPVAVAPVRKHTARTRMVRMQDGRWKKMQTQLDAQGKAIDATRQDLSSTRTELQGSIARTHDELVVLEKKGEHNYVEFDLNKAKQFQAEGPIGIKLRKSNVKHQYADLELLVDDKSLTKKHVNLYEPATFYSADSEQPVQLVINQISKDHIHGYVSAPKYGRGELAAMSQQGSQSAPNPVTKPRQKLTVPQ